MNIAIIGSTGNVGRKTIEILEKTKLKFDEIYLVASKKSLGKKSNFKNIKWLIMISLKITIFIMGAKSI